MLMRGTNENDYVQKLTGPHIKMRAYYCLFPFLLLLLSTRAMQIDSRNFDEHIDLILKDIETAHFVSFDCQFTGLVTQLQHIEGLFPDHREFYQRIKETALNFNLLQLGLTLFHYHEGQYYPKSYNFYVSGAARMGFNKIIVAEWESMAFLARNGMDFSNAFRYGIDYHRLENEEETEGTYNPLEQRVYGLQTVFFSPEDREAISNIEQIINNEERTRIDFKSKRIFDHFRNKFDISFDKPKKNMERYEYQIRVYKKEELEFEKEAIRQQSPNNLCEKVEEISLQQKKPNRPRTLEVVIQKIISCGKPFVGHFPNLDLGLIYHSFIGELPATYEQFTDKINKLFPFIFDTKVISRRIQNRLKSIKVDLKSLYKSCFNKKLLQPYANINYKYVEAYVQSDSSHQAGYDSFMTGCACIAMLNFIYEVKQAPFVFANAETENKILYSKFAGEVSLVGPVFSQKTAEYRRKIVIFSGTKKQHDAQSFGDTLSKRGTLSLYQDHGEAYYFFDQQQDIEQILQQFKSLKPYDQRRVIPSRDMFH